MSNSPILSLIIPAYNEARRLPETLPQVIDFVHAQPYTSEVIVVDNNSSDDTRKIAEDFARQFPVLQVLYEPQQGKGAAVRTGMLASKGEYIFMADADLSMGYRHLMGRIFNLIVKLIAVPGFQDTQCGFKCFRRQAALDVLSRQSINGWAFDVELLFIAQKRNYRIVEVPINWYYRANSRISPLKDAFEMVREVVRIRLNGWRGVYSQTRG